MTGSMYIIVFLTWLLNKEINHYNQNIANKC